MEQQKETEKAAGNKRAESSPEDAAADSSVVEIKEKEKTTAEKLNKSLSGTDDVKDILNNEKIKRIKIFMDLASIIDTLKDKNILVVTPLTKDKVRLENSLSDDDVPLVSVKKILESIDFLRSSGSGVNGKSMVIVSKYSIASEMGLWDDLVEAIGEKRRVIVALESSSESDMLSMYKMASKKMVKKDFFIEGRTVLSRLGMLFALTKVRPIKNICIVVSHIKEERRVEVFLKAFGIKVEISPNSKKEGVIGIFNTNSVFSKTLLERYSLVVDNTGGVGFEILNDVKVGVLKIVTTGKPVDEDPRFKKLQEQAMKYKYRIESVIQMITPNVLKKKNEIDEKTIKHLQGPLRII